MNSKKINVLPDTERYLKVMGEQIKLARLRRNIALNLVAERAGISRVTLSKIEKGDPSVAIAAYANTLHALNGMDKDLLLVAKDDEFGRKVQDLRILTKRRSSKNK